VPGRGGRNYGLTFGKLCDNQFMWPERKQIRLKAFDYSQPGAYYITICTHQKKCVFGEIIEEKMILNPIGKIAHFQWGQLVHRFPNITLDQFIVMPNHLHGIIIIHENLNHAYENKQKPPIDQKPSINKFQQIIPGSLGSIIRTYKGTVSRRYHQTRFVSIKPLWQRGFYDRVINDEDELNTVREYIIFNPKMWGLENMDHPIENQPKKTPT
jgi:REP element-mobilizing transposase RayT